jgi:hypothetical protein
MKTNIKIDFQGVISILVLFMTIAIVGIILFKPIPAENKDVVNFVLGVVVGTAFVSVINYWVGSSKGSADKNEIIKIKPNNTTISNT